MRSFLLAALILDIGLSTGIAVAQVKESSPRLPSKKVKSKESSQTQNFQKVPSKEKKIYLNFATSEKKSESEPIQIRVDSETSLQQINPTLEQKRENETSLNRNEVVVTAELPVTTTATDRDGVLSLNMSEPEVASSTKEAITSTVAQPPAQADSCYDKASNINLSLGLGVVSLSQNSKIQDRAFLVSSPSYQINFSMHSPETQQEFLSLSFQESLGLSAQSKADDAQLSSAKLQNLVLNFGGASFEELKFSFFKDDFKLNDSRLNYSGITTSGLGFSFQSYKSNAFMWSVSYYPRVWLKERSTIESYQTGYNPQVQRLGLMFQKEFGFELIKRHFMRLQFLNDFVRFEEGPELNVGKAQNTFTGSVAYGFLL